MTFNIITAHKVKIHCIPFSKVACFLHAEMSACHCVGEQDEICHPAAGGCLGQVVPRIRYDLHCPEPLQSDV